MLFLIFSKHFCNSEGENFSLSSKYEDDSNDDFTSIKQLIVDIDAQDNSEWMRITKSGIGTPFATFKQTSKMYRFEKAFNEFFNGVKFKSVDNTNREEINILFITFLESEKFAPSELQKYLLKIKNIT